MTPDADELQDDIEVLRVLIDAALDSGADYRLVAAISSILRDRREQLERLERVPSEYRAA